MTPPVQIRCGFGLAGRVAAIANGKVAYGRISFVWRNNEHCPMRHQDVFPEGIPDVEFDETAPPALMTRIGRFTVDSWDCTENATARNPILLEILDAMEGSAVDDPPPLAIMARFHRRSSTDPAELGKAAAFLAIQRQASSVLIMADAHRQEIAASFREKGISPRFPQSPEMTHDKDRSPASVRAFISDWKTLLRAKTILTASEESGILYPAHAKGIEVLAL